MSGASAGERAGRGEIEAQLELGRQCALTNVREARGWFARAAKAGSVDGLRLLAISLLVQEPVERSGGINMIRAAADKGDAHAAHICATLAATDSALPDRWAIARDCLKIAAGRGWAPAQKQLEFIESADFPPEDFKPPSRPIFAKPRMSEFKGFLSGGECAWLIERARPLLRRAQVYNAKVGGNQVSNERTNSTADFGIVELDVVISRVRERIADAVGDFAPDWPSVLHYTRGQEFTPHYDFLDAEQPAYGDNLAGRNQRAATFLIYLNEDFEGGETMFPKLNFRFRGRRGDALLFWNLDEAGKPDLMTEHAGLSPTSGEKWLFSQWLLTQPRART